MICPHHGCELTRWGTCDACERLVDGAVQRRWLRRSVRLDRRPSGSWQWKGCTGGGVSSPHDDGSRFWAGAETRWCTAAEAE